MGFKLLERVYAMTDYKMSGTELSVLAALAFRANDKTLLCFPKLETLAKMTHLARSTVWDSLNELKKYGYLEWDSGGLKNKRGKGGRILANSYRLNFPEKPKKANKAEVINNMSGGQDSYRQPDTTVTASRTLQLPPAGHYSYRQPDSNINITSNTKPIPNRRESGLDLEFEEAAKSMDLRVRYAPPTTESPTAKIFRLCEIPESDIGMRAGCMKTLTPLLVKLRQSKIEDILYAFESEKKQGELETARSYFAVLVDRLKKYAGVS